MTQKLTIQDIANLAGVAKSTVSRYLNNGYVSKEKAMLIDKVIRETGYKSNFFAKRLKTKQSKLIGIVMPRLDSFSAGKLLTGFNIILQQMGYYVKCNTLPRILSRILFGCLWHTNCRLDIEIHYYL